MLIVHRVLWKGKSMKSGKGGDIYNPNTIWKPNRPPPHHLNIKHVWYLSPHCFGNKGLEFEWLTRYPDWKYTKMLKPDQCPFFKLFYNLCTVQQKDLTVTIWILDLNAIQMVQSRSVWKWPGIQISSECRPNSPLLIG